MPNNPVVYNRSDGQRLRSAPGTGATYALLTGDTLTFGPGKTGQLGVVEEGVKDQLASFSGNHMIVTPGMSYLHSDKELSALDRVRYLGLTKQRGALAASQREITKKLKELQKRAETPEKAKLKEQIAELGKKIDATVKEMSECVPWKQPCRYPLCLILAGQALVAGGEGEIGAFNAGDGQQIWKGAVTGKAFGLAASGGRLYASTDQGTIHCFSSAASRASAGGRTPSSTGGPRP